MSLFIPKKISGFASKTQNRIGSPFNSTEADYSLQDLSAITLMRWSEMNKSLEGPVNNIKIRLPLFIPPGQKQEIDIRVPISETYLPDNYKSYAGTKKEALYRVPTYQGFVLFDQGHRYRINFPKCDL
jgi:hypothetical protein